jgi:hypothetical protein
MEIALASPAGNHAMGEAREAVATVSTVILWLVSSAFLPRSVICACVLVVCGIEVLVLVAWSAYGAGSVERVWRFACNL